MTEWSWLRVLAAALTLTALNAFKPLHVDDPIYLTYAIEFAAHPTRPYDFQFGSPFSVPANDLLVPPAVPYWLGLGLRVVGDSPVMLKFWMLPFAVLLAFGVDFLAARSTASLRGPMVWLCLLSPTLLPGFNLMLEVPVLALELAAISAAVRSVERQSHGLGIVAGLLSAIAFQTKYTGAAAGCAAVMWCALNRHWLRGAAIFVVSACAVLGWEFFVARAQGASHFLIHFRQRQGDSLQRAVHLILPLVSHIAGLAAVIALLGIKALGWNRRVPVAAAIIVGSAIALACVPSNAAIISSVNGRPILTASHLVYAALAVLVWPTLAAIVLQVARRSDTIDRFLVAWLAIELMVYFAMSPFPAARRVVGVQLVLTLLVGRVARLRAMSEGLVRKFVFAGTVWALLFFVTDWQDAAAARAAAQEIASREWFRTKAGTCRHLSWWGFPYYAERLGIGPLQINRDPPRSGDLLVVQDIRELQEFVRSQPALKLELIDPIEVGDQFWLQVLPSYYNGGVPLEHHAGSRFSAQVYRCR